MFARTFVWQGVQVHYFIFQSVPGRYDLKNEIRTGKRDTWYATRYRNKMCIGDVVFFWMSGAARGIYGWGRITSEPYLKPSWGSHGIDVEYKNKFKQQVSGELLRRDNILSDMLIFRAPSATNFLLTTDQARRLMQIIEQQGEVAPSTRELET